MVGREAGEVGGVGDPLDLVRQAGDGEAAVADCQVAGDAEVLGIFCTFGLRFAFQDGNDCHTGHSQCWIVTRSYNRARLVFHYWDNSRELCWLLKGVLFRLRNCDLWHLDVFALHIRTIPGEDKLTLLSSRPRLTSTLSWTHIDPHSPGKKICGSPIQNFFHCPNFLVFSPQSITH